MGMMKQYLLKLLQQCSEEKFGQDAIEWAVLFLLLAAALFYFLNNNGFIDASSIQPYPY